MDENNNIQSNNQINNQPIPTSNEQPVTNVQTSVVNSNVNTDPVGISTVTQTQLDNKTPEQPLNQVIEPVEQGTTGSTPSPVSQATIVNQGPSPVQSTLSAEQQPSPTKVTEQKEQKKMEVASPMQAEKAEIDASKSTGPMIIFFILIFGFVIGLPYLTDYLEAKKQAEKDAVFEEQLKQQEDQMKQEEDKEKEPTYTTVTCTLPAEDHLTTTVATTQTFSHLNDKLKQVTITNNFVYKAEDTTYETNKESCQQALLNSSSSTIDGYEFNCAINDLAIEESKTYDLEEFQSTETQITAPYQKDASVSTIIENLKTQGYTCN